MLKLTDVQARPIPQRLQSLFAMLQSQSGTMMRHSLALRGIKVPQSATVADIARYVIAHVHDGDLTIAEGREIAFQCREYSNKRAYLFQADPTALSRWRLPAELASRVVPDFAHASITAAQSERVQYIRHDDGNIRVLLTETHRSYRQDEGSLALIPVDELRYIVLEANRRTGAVTLLMDAAGRRHDHGNAARYKLHYEQRAKELLGTELTALPLEQALTRLDEERLLDIPHAQVAIAGGLMSLSAPGSDIRNLPEYRGMRSSCVLHDSQECVWLPQPHDNPGGLTVPVRPLKTMIHARAGEVRFALHSLPIETNYVLAQLRRTA